MYSWRIEPEDSFHALRALIAKANLHWDDGDIRRRVIIPLFLQQLIGFYDEEDRLRGFLTVAFMDEFAAEHMPSIGILPADWRCGNDFWVVDLVAVDGDGQKMLRTITRDLKGTAIAQVRYFRLKHQQMREVRI